MTNAAKRFLFNAHNRRGLGHLMRGLNIAREIRKISNNSDILFYTRSESASELCDKQFQYFIEQDLEQNSHWTKVINDFQPDVVIYDTLLPKDTADTPPCSGHTAYIMRKCKPERQQEIFDHAFLQTVDLILIPHEPEEFGYPLPTLFENKSHFVGPIIRQADPDLQQQLSQKYQLQPDEFLLTSTVGGGGFEDKARAFFTTIFEVHKHIAEHIPNLRHLVIKGPNFTEPLAELAGIEVIDSEREMVNLLALSDLVIAEGGYNTVNEIRLAKTPTIFLPSDRNYDDQFERVLELADKGFAYVFQQAEPANIANKIVSLATESNLLTSLRDSYKADNIQTGNASAAQHLIRLATQ